MILSYHRKLALLVFNQEEFGGGVLIKDRLTVDCMWLLIQWEVFFNDVAFCIKCQDFLFIHADIYMLIACEVHTNFIRFVINTEMSENIDD